MHVAQTKSHHPQTTEGRTNNPDGLNVPLFPVSSENHMMTGTKVPKRMAAQTGSHHLSFRLTARAKYKKGLTGVTRWAGSRADAMPRNRRE